MDAEEILPESCETHFFLSHYQASGGDQVDALHPEKSVAPLKCVVLILGKCNKNVEKMSRTRSMTTKMSAGDIL